MKEHITITINFPDDVHFNLEDGKLIVKHDGKEVVKEFNLSNIHIKKDGQNLVLESKQATKKEKKMMNTIEAHIKNIIRGFNEEFVYRLEVAYLHFPITLDLQKDKGIIIIKNFLGEKKPRVSKIVKGADVEINKNTIIVKSHDREVAGQTAANIEKATKIRNRDRRKFQDGIFLVERCGKVI